MNRDTPPRLGELLLKRVVPSGVEGQSIVGDAREEYAEQLQSTSRLSAAIWYWRHVLSITSHLSGRSRPRSTHRIRRRTNMSHLIYDFKLASRMLLKKPGLTLAAILTLGLGIGANTTIFSVVDGVLLKPLPYPDPDRLVVVFRIDPDVTGEKPQLSRIAGIFAVPFPVFRDWRDLSPVFESAGAYAGSGFTLTGGDRPEVINGATVTSGVFEALGVKPMLGRPILPEEDSIGAPSAVVLSHGLWQRRFASDNAILGQQIVLSGVPHSVVGIMPPEFRFPGEDEELWATFADRRRSTTIRNAGFLQVIARLEPGIPLEQAQQEMDAVALQIGEAHPEERELGIGLYPRKDMIVSSSKAGLLLLLGAVGLVLLIACANMANLLLVRASERRRELGVRQALGAGWGRLLVQHFSESLVLSLVGGTAGYLIALVSLRPFIASFPGGLPRAGEITVDYRLLVFAISLSVMTGLLTGALPALRAVRTPIVEVLRDGGRGYAGGRRRNRTQAALVVSEVAFAFVLLAGAALFIKSFLSITSVEPGFEPQNLFLTRVSLPSQYRDSDEASAAFFRDMIDRLGALPGVQSIASAGQMPMVGGWSFPPTSIETSKEVVDDNVHTTSVTPEYFSTMSIPFIAGRGFTRADRQGTQPVAVINEAMARRYFPDEDPIGRRVRRDDDPRWSAWHTVVGVVGDTRYKLDWEPFPAFFVPYAQRPLPYQTVILRTSIDPIALTPAVRETLRAINPNMPALTGTLTDRINQSEEVTGQRFQTSLLGCLSALAALLAIVGIYGVLSYTVSQRSHEIGIRMAFGAGKNHVVLGVLGRGLVMTATGLGIGLAITLAASRLMESLLFEVSPTDPTTLIGVALLIVAAALAASYVPARRATRVDPAEALRQE